MEPSPSQELSAAAAPSQHGPKRRRRQRAQLSCSECRQMKLSCDRQWPCERCVKAGRQWQCSFETPMGQPAGRPALSQGTQQSSTSDLNKVNDLEARVKHLESLIQRSGVAIDTESNKHPQMAILDAPVPEAGSEKEIQIDQLQPTLNVVLSDHPSRRAPSGYYGQHSVFKFFKEIPLLFPFMNEVVQEQLEPAGFRPKKARHTSRDVPKVIPNTSEGHLLLSSLLPSKEDTDCLISIYMDQFEHLHRVIHVPTFERDYTGFWATAAPRSLGMTVLVLSMAAAATCASIVPDGQASVGSMYSGMLHCWIDACETWLKQQSHKHRGLEYYQVLCITYIAKRMDMTHKKRFWTESGGLIQSAIIDGLHSEQTPNSGRPFVQEMKRRLWHTIRELELQNSYEYGLPTLLHNIASCVAVPANVHDEAIHETIAQASPLGTSTHFTRTSYQSVSASSWELRLDISRRLFSPGSSTPLRYGEVMSYTERVNQALCDLAEWTLGPSMSTNPRARQNLALVSTLLRLQLKECILALHRPQLQHDKARSCLSESICYQASWDILLLNRELTNLGVHTLSQLREDLLVASLSLTRVILLQSLGSSSIILASSTLAVELLEQCLPIMETRYLRYSDSKPWCFLTMCASFMLLRVHLGLESRESAKISTGRRLLQLHERHLKGQAATNQRVPTMSGTPLIIEEPFHPDIALPSDFEWFTEPFYSAFEQNGLDMGIDYMDGSTWGCP